MPQSLFTRPAVAYVLLVVAIALGGCRASATAQQTPTAATAAPQAVTKDKVDKKALESYRAGADAGRKGDRRNAERYLNDAIEREPGFVDAVVELASLYYAAGEYAEAETYLERAAGYAGRAGYEALYGLAMAELKQEKYDEAAEHLAGYLAHTEPREDRRVAAESFLADARFRARALANPIAIALEPLPPAINTPEQAEYLPALSADGRTLVFTRRVGNRQEDFFVSTRSDTGWTEALPLENVNTPDNEGAQSLSADGRHLVFTACNREDGLGSCDLYAASLVDGHWTPPVNLGAPVNTKAWESQPALSANGDLLFFASKRAGGHGGADLYASGRTATGAWSEPINLGPVVNSAKDDQAPYFHADGRTLYFMSEGHPGMGGFDLYVARLGDDRAWQTPTNLGYPLNTEANEGALAVALDGRTAYFATDTRAADPTSLTTGGTRGGATDLYTFALPPDARAGAATYLLARVVDAVTDRPVAAVATLSDPRDERPFLKRRASATDGSLLVVLPAGQPYALAVEEPGYAFYSDRFELTEAASIDEPFELLIRLQPLTAPTGQPEAPAEGAPIVLRNVLFATASAELLPESRAELTRLRALLDDNPTLRIRLQGHTDDVGDDAANQELSQRRAAAVREFLIDAGIDPARLEAVGYGETRPQVPNADAESRRLNRRTEFVILQR